MLAAQFQDKTQISHCWSSQSAGIAELSLFLFIITDNKIYCYNNMFMLISGLINQSNQSNQSGN